MTLEERIADYFVRQGFIATSDEDVDRLALASCGIDRQTLYAAYYDRAHCNEELAPEMAEAIARCWHLIFPHIPEMDRHVLAELYRLITELGRETPDRPLRILDVGCGVGLSLAFLASEFPEHAFVAYDREPLWVRAAEARSTALGLANVTLRVGCHADVSLIGEEFDLFLCIREGGVDAPCCQGMYDEYCEHFAYAIKHYELQLAYLRPAGLVVEVRRLNHFALELLGYAYEKRLGLERVEHVFFGPLDDQPMCHDDDPIMAGIVTYRYRGSLERTQETRDKDIRVAS